MGSSRPAGAAVTNGADVRRGPAEPALSPYRVLIYSHDSFGLGHLRRCRAIAHALVEQHRKLNVLILSGSPIIGRFSFRARVDFVRVPGVIKLRNGEYTSLNLDVNLEHALALRASIIEHTARVFEPKHRPFRGATAEDLRSAWPLLATKNRFGHDSRRGSG